MTYLQVPVILTTTTLQNGGYYYCFITTGYFAVSYNFASCCLCDYFGDTMNFVFYLIKYMFYWTGHSWVLKWRIPCAFICFIIYVRTSTLVKIKVFQSASGKTMFARSKLNLYVFHDVKIVKHTQIKMLIFFTIELMMMMMNLFCL